MGAVAPASLTPRARARFEAVLREKLDWFGAPLARLAYPEAETAALGQAVEESIAAGARIVVVAGANALDPLDPVFTALERIGGRLVRNGVPAHPGSLLWVARVGPVPVLGMPGCGMFSQATLFDLLLPRLLAGETVGPEDARGVRSRRPPRARDGLPVPALPRRAVIAARCRSSRARLGHPVHERVMSKPASWLTDPVHDARVRA